MTLIGQQIGQYQIVEVIGEGGMATVYRAHQVVVGRDVAIKLLPGNLSDDPSFLRRFQNEAKLVARLEHRSILPVYDYGEFEGRPYLVMRLLEGGTLRRYMSQGPLDPGLLARVLMQVAEALDYAHARGVIHRDLKPSNILMDDRDNAYLTDFGIARILGQSSRTTGHGVMGTPTYMSPEQCQGKELGPASDIYSLGVMAYELLTGRPPFLADSPLSVMYMHVRDALPPARSIEPSLPGSVDRALARALAKQPDRRYRSAVGLAEDLARGLRGWTRDPGLQETVARRVPAQYSGEHIDRPVVLPEDTDNLLRARSGGSSIGAWIGLIILLGAVATAVSVLLLTQSGQQPAPTLPVLPSTTPDLSLLLSPVAVIDAPTPTASLPPAVTAGPTPTPLLQPTRDPLLLPTLTSIVTFSALDPTSLFPSPSPTVTPAFVTGLLVYTQGVGDASEIVIMDANGRDFRRLTTNTWYDSEPDLSPDGLRIAFESGPDGGRDIYVMASTGGNLQPITATDAEELHPDWSPDGRLIAFEASDGSDSEIYVMNANGTARVQVTNNNFGDRAPQFSPDGTRLAYMTDQRGIWEIAVMAYPGGQQVAIFSCPAPDCRFPVWSPDGTRLAYNTLNSAGKVADIWLVNISTGQSTPLVQGGENGRPTFSGDGGFIFFNRTVEENTDIFRVSVITRVLERLTLSTERDYGPDWGSNAP